MAGSLQSELGKLTKTLQVTAKSVDFDQRKAVGAMAFELKKTVSAQILRATGGKGRLSGTSKKGAKVSVRYDVMGQKNPVAKLYAYGPLQLIERGTKPHPLTKARKKRSRIRRTMKIGGNFVGSSVENPIMHPGTKGKYPFKTGVKLGEDKAREAYGKVMRGSLKKFK